MIETRSLAKSAAFLGWIVFVGLEAPAQVPLDGIALGSFSNITLALTNPGGLAFLDTAGMTTTLAGGLACIEVNSVAIDPYDQTKILLGGINPGVPAGATPSPCPSAGILTEATVSGTTVTGSTTIALPVTTSLADIVFDDDGNVFVGTGTSIYKVDRATSISTLLVGALPGTANALAYDPVGNDLYAGITVVGQVRHVDPETGALTNLNGLSVAGVTGSATISGLTLSEDRTKIYACTFGTGTPGGPSGATWIVELPTNAALWPAIPMPLDVAAPIGSPSLNDIEIHGTKLYTTSSSNTDVAFEIDLSVPPPHPVTVVSYFPGGIGASFGVGSQLAVNEFKDDLTVFPRRPTAGTMVSFKLALGGPPGDLGIIGIVGVDPDGTGPAPFIFTPLIIGIGFFSGVEGNYALPPLPVALAASNAGSVITLGAGRISGGSLVMANFAAATVEIQ